MYFPLGTYQNAIREAADGAVFWCQALASVAALADALAGTSKIGAESFLDNVGRTERLSLPKLLFLWGVGAADTR